MHLHLITILFIILEHINKIFTQGIPVSPCPKIFQYRFDGAEWFGIVSVRNPDHGHELHLRVTLSMRGKPTTNFLGEIELLTRGQFRSDSSVLYKIKFPPSHFPPKLLQISVNNHVVCLGAADHSIFVTQIQLEHTRKFTFITEDMALPASLTPGRPSLPSPSSSSPSSAPSATSSLSGFADTATGLLPTNIAFGTKHLPFANFDKNPMHVSKDICGKIDDRIRFQVLHALKSGRGRGKNEMESDWSLAGGGGLLPKDTDAIRLGSGHGASIPLVTSIDDDDADDDGKIFMSDDDNDDNSDDSSTTTINDLPSITRGAWPWLAAIYVNNLTSLAYQCGGTLVSQRIVISSGHCFKMFKRSYTANELLVFLGRHNLKNWNEEGSLAAPVDDIFIHPDYDGHLNSYDADIAILVLKNEVRFNTFIRPACLWSGSTKTEYIEGEHGIVVGWGLGGINSTAAALSSATTVPKVINAPIVSNDVCFKANDKFRSLSSNRTFCAGVVVASTTKPKKPQKLQSGPCTGDSGAGLMIFKNNRWLLRGTVSAALPTASASDSVGGGGKDSHKSSCNVNQFVVYTDVAKFLDWIFAFMI